MKKNIQKILYLLAKKILKIYQPQIIAITGSVGKTSVKEAVYLVLKDNFSVATNIKNYNTEFGVPLTIIKAKSGGKNILKWLTVILKALKKIICKDKKYPKILILEMAADHPGDIEYLVKLAQPNLAIITAIGPAHMEFFGSLENIIKEKQTLITKLNKDAQAILNADDNLVLAMKNKTEAQVLTYGLGENALVRATNIRYEDDGSGIYCTINYGQETAEAHFKNVLALTQVGSLMAAITVGLIYKMSLENIIQKLIDFKFPAGRLQLLAGIKKTQIIDDTYNSSPKAVKVALEVLSRIACSSRRLAVLGDMLELGNYSETAHAEVGEWVKEYKIDILIAVGQSSKKTAEVAEINGLAREHVLVFDTAFEAGKFLQNEIVQGDLILVKGSQSMRMERVVKEIMAEPNRAEELLVRQSEGWLTK